MIVDVLSSLTAFLYPSKQISIILNDNQPCKTETYHSC